MCTTGTEARGFTLLEMLVVLVIASLAISMVGPAFQHLLPGLTLEAESRKLEAMLRHARSQAILTASEVRISQEGTDGLRLSYREQAYSLPKGFELEVEQGPAQGEKAPGAGQILFYPSGDSSGGGLRLKMEERREFIRVDWLSGRVQRGEAPPEDEPRKRQKKPKPHSRQGDGDE